MRRSSAFAILALVALAVAGGCQTRATAPSEPAAAEAEHDDGLEDESAFPDLTGTWVGQVRAIYTGVEGPHAFEVARGGINIDALRFVVQIDLQDEQLFHGTLTSTGEPDPFLGAIRSDGAIAVYTTERGAGVLTLLDANMMEACHTRGTEISLMATCVELRRAVGP